MARPDLGARIRALREAADLADGRVDPGPVTTARGVVERAGRRLELAGDNTVVAIGGATGSGKSSLFNALTGTELAVPGVRRPTTATAMAVSFAERDSAEPLLDWLEVPTRYWGGDLEHAPGLDRLVLIDMPDHDSTALAHQQQVDRLVQLVDSIVWVVDPQKYADAALHNRYLKPLAAYSDVMLIVLNQIDTLSAEERKRCLADLRRLLDSEGLGRAEVLAVSAATGEGVDKLRATLRTRVSAKKAAATRVAHDVRTAGEALARANGTKAAGTVSRETADRLNKALAVAANVPIVTEAVGNAWRHRGSLATGWPALAWLGRFRPDPLKRLHLDRLGIGKRRTQESIDPVRAPRTSLPTTNSVQQARVDAAVRDLSDEVTPGLGRGWRDAVRAATQQHRGIISDRLDRAIATTDLGLDADRGWWRAITVLQWILIVAVLAGLIWLGVDFLMLYLQLPPLPTVQWRGFGVQTLLVVGGVAAGLLVALFARIGVEIGARSKQRSARRALQKSIARVTDKLVIEPVNAEVTRYETVRRDLAEVLGPA
ncbi:GTPase [Granulicoccus phenolivorans]|uniref:GTPase n=1 Tax=Granulicoccus phenolivorans TaxID=266854 RepID=UPI000405D8E1|nr:GTPase [Granulicoccus phenolivorans]